MSGLLSSPPSSPSYRRSRRGFARRCERICCGVLTYFPLVFVYGLTSWAVWVQFKMGLLPENSFGFLTSTIGVLFYILLNWSYTTAVFTNPGTPALTDVRSSDLHLTPVTVKSTGEMRYCKKCQARKPDRAHHCSTCRRCVLKMDHHCPWLATCVGLRNYKAFLLFLTYTSLFCWLCFFVSGAWVWKQVMINGTMDENSLMPVHFVVLSIVSGIIGLVISGFTGWHIYLTTQNRTTIESLEKTRYLSPLRSHVSQRLNHVQSYADNQNHSFGEQLRDLGNSLTEIHANALPGVLRPEEGEERMSPAQNSLRRNYEWDSYSNRREQEQYNEYLDERDNGKLPNAFHLGWKRNLIAVMGPSPWLWAFPVCNSIGDGWVWEQNGDWMRQRERLKQERQMEAQRRGASEGTAGWAASRPRQPDPELGLSKADRVLGRRPGQYADGLSTPRPPPRSSTRPEGNQEDIYDSSDDETSDGRTRLLPAKMNSHSSPHSGAQATENWNDVPDDMVRRK